MDSCCVYTASFPAMRGLIGENTEPRYDFFLTQIHSKRVLVSLYGVPRGGGRWGKKNTGVIELLYDVLLTIHPSQHG